jgi:hypothetical protein
MNDICTPSAIVILQDAIPLVSSMDILPGTQTTNITKAEGLAMKHNITTQRNTVGHKQKVSNMTTYTSSPKRVKGAQQSAK